VSRVSIGYSPKSQATQALMKNSSKGSFLSPLVLLAITVSSQLKDVFQDPLLRVLCVTRISIGYSLKSQATQAFMKNSLKS